MRTTIHCFFYFVIFINSNLLPQNQNDDYGELFIKAVNSDYETEQKEIISKIFSQSAVSETGIDMLLAFVKKMNAEYAPLTFHHSEVLSFEIPEGKSHVMHIYAKQPDAVMWKDFQWRLDPEPPHKLKSVAFTQWHTKYRLTFGSIRKRQQVGSG